MAELEPVGEYPWQPQSTILGNLAIGNLRHNLLGRLTVSGRVHAETLLTTVGALAGFSAQNAVWQGVIRKGKQVPKNGFLVFTTRSGEKFYYGDLINAYLVPTPGGGRLTLWGFMVGAAIEEGVPVSALPDYANMFEFVTKSIGTTEFGSPRVSAEHKPHMNSPELLKLTWAIAREILLLPGPAGIQEPALSEEHWPIIISIVAGIFLKQGKPVLDPKLAIILAMESAIVASKLDPITIPMEQIQR